MSVWHLQCLLCGFKSKSLVTMQQHVITAHDYKHEEHRDVRRRQVNRNTFIWSFGDGVDWLKAIRREEGEAR